MWYARSSLFYVLSEWVVEILNGPYIPEGFDVGYVEWDEQVRMGGHGKVAKKLSPAARANKAISGSNGP